MAELSKGSSYVLKPKSRLGRWWRLWSPIVKVVMVLVGLPVGIDLGMGCYQERQLLKEIEVVRGTGAPMLLEDFSNRHPRVADAENAALALQWAADSIFWWGAAGKASNLDLKLALDDHEMQILLAELEENREPLLRLREARENGNDS